MKNTFGQSITLTLFGESHGPMIGAVLDGLTPGLTVSDESIQRRLSRRRPKDLTSTTRREADPYTICSGVRDGKTTGTPLCLLIPNADTHSSAYSALHGIARPGHSDFTAQAKYHGFQDERGGGHFSGRITAALVAAGAILGDALERKGIRIGTHLLTCAGVADRPFSPDSLETDLARLGKDRFPTLSEEAAEAMRQAILEARRAQDSVGGVLETAVTGMPAGVGEPWFDTVEGVLSHALFSVPAVKGVEFGDGFALAARRGSEVNDPYRMKNGCVTTETNHGGGVAGGLTIGTPILFRCAVKPTPSISKPQQTVNFLRGEDCPVTIGGRHDPCIAPRAAAVVDAVTSLALADLLAVRYGTDWLGEV